MTSKNIFGEFDSNIREWVTCKNERGKVAFSFPPFWGGQRECYRTIGINKEVVAAERLDLALIIEGAYTQESPKWQNVRAEYFCFPSQVRIPVRTLWIPPKHEFTGILVERDLEGFGRFLAMDMPKDLPSWTKGENGIYESPDKDMSFVPMEGYKYVEHTIDSFSKDGFATAILTAEGAEMVARAVIGAGKRIITPKSSLDEFDSPQLHVVGFEEYQNTFMISCMDHLGEGYAFAKAREK